MMISRKKLYPLLIEFISVVFAVLFALSLNAYKDTLDAKNKANSFQSSIYEECQRNKYKVDSIILKNQEYISFLDSIVSLENPDDAQFYFAFEFELLDHSVWDMARNNDAFDLIDKDFIFTASQIYENQNFLYDFSSQVFVEIGSKIMEMDQLETYSLALGIYYYVNTINLTALELQADLDSFLEEYKPPGSK